jgi:hypothetical protein
MWPDLAVSRLRFRGKDRRWMSRPQRMILQSSDEGYPHGPMESFRLWMAINLLPRRREFAVRSGQYVSANCRGEVIFSEKMRLSRRTARSAWPIWTQIVTSR